MNTTRRTFIKIAATTPLILPSSVWAAEISPNEKISLGLIGMGLQNRGILHHCLYRTQVLAVCDVDSTRRENAKHFVNDFYENNPIYGKAECTAYNDYEELLMRKDIDAVCIATPDHWHALITLAALQAGKDVYCEKPLTHSIAEAVEVMKSVDINKCILQTGSHQRSSREFRVACELARNGAIGNIDRIECSFGDPGRPCDLPGEPMEPGLDWNLWLGPAQVRSYSSILSPRGLHNHFPDWRLFMEFGGGMVTDWGAHHLDIAQWALGMDQSGPVEIHPPENRNAKRGASLIYANGVQVVHRDGFGVDIFGSEGRIQVNRGQFSFSRGNEIIARFIGREDGGTLDSKLDIAEREFLRDAKVHLYRVKGNHVDDFLGAVRSREKPITHEEVGARSAICCHLMNLAYYHGQPIKWNPAKCTFQNGSGNPAWLPSSRRNYRV